MLVIGVVDVGLHIMTDAWKWIVDHKHYKEIRKQVEAFPDVKESSLRGLVGFTWLVQDMKMPEITIYEGCGDLCFTFRQEKHFIRFVFHSGILMTVWYDDSVFKDSYLATIERGFYLIEQTRFREYVIKET